MVCSWQEALSVGAQVSAASGFIYGLFWLERYRKQKIVENQSTDAKQALEHLVIVEESLDTIFEGTEAEQKEVLLKKLPQSLREMYIALLLLKNLPGIAQTLPLLEELGDIVAHNKAHPDVAVRKIKQVFASRGNYKQECKELKEHLIRIYVLRA